MDIRKISKEEELVVEVVLEDATKVDDIRQESLLVTTQHYQSLMTLLQQGNYVTSSLLIPDLVCNDADITFGSVLAKNEVKTFSKGQTQNLINTPSIPFSPISISFLHFHLNFLS
ncbi:hypothetical protein VNO78_19805 [Psophocarpus tetragonolobus]|uniref:Uncharacterized protein n=1 Tax=Psophocarpus tetragonolobus TaxID=3891 RepID=A0AAN9XGI5_PSOTE